MFKYSKMKKMTLKSKIVKIKTNYSNSKIFYNQLKPRCILNVIYDEPHHIDQNIGKQRKMHRYSSRSYLYQL